MFFYSPKADHETACVGDGEDAAAVIEPAAAVSPAVDHITLVVMTPIGAQIAHADAYYDTTSPGSD